MASLTPKSTQNQARILEISFDIKPFCAKRAGEGEWRGVEDMEFPGVTGLNKEHVEIPKFSIIKTKRTRISRGVLRKLMWNFHGSLFFDLRISKGCRVILISTAFKYWNISKNSRVFSSEK